MMFQKFQDLCEACYVTKESAVLVYESNPLKPWSSLGAKGYTDELREQDSGNFFNEIFREDEELDLQQLSQRISVSLKRLAEEKKEGGIWATVKNIRCAIVRAASESFRRYTQLLPDVPKLDPETLRTSGKPSPYGNMQFSKFVENPEGRFTPTEETHHADYEAAAMMYNGDFLALLIGREYDMEEHMA